MDQEVHANIVTNMLGILTKTTTAQCLYLLMVAWSDVIIFQNTKRVTSDKSQQAEREKKKNWKHTQGTVISVNEVWHHILKYPEVITNTIVFMIQRTMLEKRTGKSLKKLTIQQTTISFNMILMSLIIPKKWLEA